MRFSLLFSLISVVASSRILVLVDNASVKETHSIFLRSLQERGHTLSIRLADDQSLALIKYGEKVFDHLIILAPSVEEFGGDLTAKEIAKFVDEGGNVMVVGSSNLGEGLRELAAEHGFEFDEPDTAVIDHHNYDAVLDDGYHTTIVADKKQFLNAQIVVGDLNALNPVLYKGAALIADKANRLKLEILRASSTAYSFNPSQLMNEYPGAIGKQALLIAALQARNNARVVFCGSIDMFSDAFINARVTKAGLTDKPVSSGNLALITELSKWVLKEKGVLRTKSISHHKVGEKEVPSEYTITDDVEYTIEIEELKEGKWTPFQGKDVQLEFVRIDPFVRTTLKPVKGTLVANFKLPDAIGVYKFLVDYRRVGYTHLNEVRMVPVRPLWHNQYERFIRAAYPYYASSFSMMIGVVLFSIVFLHHKEPAKAGAAAETKKTK